MPLSDFPRYPLMFGPSPVHRLDRLNWLSEHLGGAAIWAKREDCNSGLLVACRSLSGPATQDRPGPPTRAGPLPPGD